MKTKLLIAVCVLAITGSSVTPCSAGSNEGVKIIADVAVLRPVGLAATVIGSAFFVISLPFSAASGTVKQTAQTLVVRPAKATFKRPLGNMDAVEQTLPSSK